MEGILAVVFGVGMVAVSPFVPGLRPLARESGGGRPGGRSCGGNGGCRTGDHWRELIAEAQAERDAATAKANAAEAELITIPLPDK